MKAYKGFNKDMTCRGFQYEEGKEYTTDNAELCKSGFHACLDPLDCFKYYDPVHSVYHEVELDDVTNEKSYDSKICGKTIKIGARLDIAGLVKAQVEIIKSRIKKENSGGYGSVNSGRGKSSGGKNSLCCVRGNGCQAKGGIGSVIVIINEKEDSCDIDEWKAGVIDGETLKADTWYALRDGEFIEATE